MCSQPQEQGLILTSNMGFQVPGEDGGRDEAGGLILNQYGVPGAWSQPGEDGGRDEAGELVLQQHVGSRCVVSTRGGYGDKTRGLILEQ